MQQAEDKFEIHANTKSLAAEKLKSCIVSRTPSVVALSVRNVY